MAARIQHKLKSAWLYRYYGIQQLRKSYCSKSADSLQTISEVPTMHFQLSIPQLPIPSLRDTCQRYLASQNAFLNADDFRETEAAVQAFEQREGLQLQKELSELNRQNRHTSYVAGFWMDRYLLTYRTPVVLNSNPMTIIPDDKRPDYMEQTLRATNFTISILRFLKSMREDKLTPDVYHQKPSLTDNQEFWKSMRTLSSAEAYQCAVTNSVYPLDMSQFSHIFNASRIPKPTRDELFKDETQRHLLVLCKGHMYVFDVLDKNGCIISSQDLRASFNYIIQHSRSLPPLHHPIGYLTTENRDVWAGLRQSLVETCKDNAANVKLVDSSLFCVCLEDEASNDPIRTGLCDNAANRWFDKSFQLIVMKDGQLLVNQEHSWGDGVTLKRFCGDSYNDSIKKPAMLPTGAPVSSLDCLHAVKRLEFKLNPTIRQGIDQAKAHHTTATSQLNIEEMCYNKYGSSLVKQAGISPDAVLQLALQMGYQRVAGHVPSTHEPCSTAMFKHGRTETIRSATAETRRCTEAFNQGSQALGIADRRSLINACSDKHRQLIMEARAGQGWDRHLFALHALATKSGHPLPTIFQNQSYANINSRALTSVTVGEERGQAALAPRSPDECVVHYHLSADAVRWTTTSYQQAPASLSDFGRSICEAFDDIYDVLDATS